MSEHKTGRRRLVGVVHSDKMMKTVTVVVARRVQDPLYRKYVSRGSKYKAHDAEGVAHVGDTVEIEMLDAEGHSVFGRIAQKVVRAGEEPAP